MQNETSVFLDNALVNSRCVVSVIGDHAGEDISVIFRRKIADIKQVGKTFWLTRSFKSKPSQVQHLCKFLPVYVIFIEPSLKGGSRPTITEESALEYSSDRCVWSALPSNMGPVTGRIDKGAFTLVFDDLVTVAQGTLDLWDYADQLDTSMPLRFKLGCSTICAVRGNMLEHPDRMKSRYRKIVAVARLSSPYCVWLR